MNNFAKYRPPMLGILRIATALTFMEHGTQKLFQFPPMGRPSGGGAGGAGAGGPPAGGGIAVLFLIGGILETFGGLAILLGLLTRPIAFILAGETAIAYFQVHFPRSPFPSVNQGTPAVLFCLLFLYFAFAGGGAWSLDSLIARLKHWRPYGDVHADRNRLVYR